MPELAEVFRRYGGAYLARFGGSASQPSASDRGYAPLSHGGPGGAPAPGDPCGQEHYVYHSCRNRSCPKCHRTNTEAWLEERRQELLPVPYFHVVFTVPHELGEIIRRHQQDLYDILLRAAAQSLMKLAMDPHDVGGLIGVLYMLHTWTRTLAYHPHVHCLVPAGAVSPDRSQWQPARTSPPGPRPSSAPAPTPALPGGPEPSAPRESPDRARQPPACEYSPLQAGQLCRHELHRSGKEVRQQPWS